MSDPKQNGIADHPELRALTARWVRDAGERLVSLVLYGPAAHGETTDRRGWHLLAVLTSLELDALSRVSDAVNHGLGRGLPMPRLFSPSFLETAADVFPIEILDISSHHVILHGADPFGAVRIDPACLRLQCERELREKMMRLQEAYLETRGRARALRRLAVESFRSFALVFRGCLRLLGEPVPPRDLEVARRLAVRLGLDAGVFEIVAEERAADVESWFRTYYERLTEILNHIDRHLTHTEERAP